MDLNNKSIVFLGDSITEGTGTSNPSMVYWRVLETLTGAVCYGYGIGGTRIAKQYTPSQEPKWDRHFSSRVDEMKRHADIVAVFGGTNDFGHGDAPLGTFADETEQSFYGALHHLIRKLIMQYPSAQLIMMTPLHRQSEDDNPQKNEQHYPNGKRLVEYVDAISEVAAFYGIPVLDLYRTCSMQPRLPVMQERFMPDGLHPNDAGHALIARRLAGFLRSL
ncbi:MAG TPA: SGNH/GDSL hydrolase family protein [Candidatus Limiplasma sp.]|nr:SGNH/GDSL hydrolase family protein [Candidatus Limiplasma sp.]